MQAREIYLECWAMRREDAVAISSKADFESQNYHLSYKRRLIFTEVSIR